MGRSEPRRLLAPILIGLSFAATVSSVEARPRPAPIRIVDAVCPLPPNGARTAEGGFVIVNGGAADRLIAVSSPAAERMQVHSMTMQGGVMRMAAVAGGVAVPAHGRAAVDAAHGLHAMFIGLKRPFSAGDRIPLTLTFRRAGAVSAACVVRPRG